MEGDGRRQGPSNHGRPLKRSASDSSLSSSNGTGTGGLGGEELSSLLAVAGAGAAANSAGQLLDRILRQRTNPPTPNQQDLVPNQQDLVPNPPDQQEQQWEQHYFGGLNDDQSISLWQSGGSLWQADLTLNLGQVVIVLDSALAQSGGIPQVNDPRLRSRLISEVRIAMGLQASGGTIHYRTHTRFPGYWRLLDVVYVPDDQEDENDGMRLDIDHMSYEELLALGEGIGSVSTGLSNEEIMARLRQRKYPNCIETVPSAGERNCCICQEEYAADDDVGALDCEHEYHVTCIAEWLAQKNFCPICKKTALAPKDFNPRQ